MKEIEIQSGQGIIDILFDGIAGCLVIKKALAVNWPDNAGSVGEYYSISNFSQEERNSYTNILNEVLSQGEEVEQMEAVKAFLKLFANGKYQIEKRMLAIGSLGLIKSGNTTYADHVPEEKRFSGCYWPSYNSSEAPFMFTIPSDKINPERVNYYCRLIEAGGRPTILTFTVFNTLLEEYSHTYILDGHHKAEAYWKLQVEVPVIFIFRREDSQTNTIPLLCLVKLF